VKVYRWVQRFTPLLAEAARPCRHRVGDRWQVDETYVKVAGEWRYVYRAIDQFGQVVDVFVSRRRDANAARRFLEQAIGTTKVIAVEVTTDQAPVYPTMLEELLPAAWHRTDCYANNRVEADHGRLKARLRPMRGLKQERSARVVIAGHAFIQNVGADTTSWPLRSRRIGGWRLRSTSSPWPSDQLRLRLQHALGRTQRNTAGLAPGPPAAAEPLEWRAGPGEPAWISCLLGLLPPPVRRAGRPAGRAGSLGCGMRHRVCGRPKAPGI
jgi:transposase-like protein